jgi:hypothetical protein
MLPDCNFHAAWLPSTLPDCQVIFKLPGCQASIFTLPGCQASIFTLPGCQVEALLKNGTDEIYPTILLSTKKAPKT